MTKLISLCNRFGSANLGRCPYKSFLSSSPETGPRFSLHPHHLPPCPIRRPQQRVSTRPHQKASTLSLPCRTLRRAFYRHLYRKDAPTGVRFPQMPAHHRARTSRRTRRSSTRSHSCGVSTGIRSARWIRQACAHASSRSTRLGICSRDASLMFDTAPSPMAVCGGRRSRWAFACSPAWKRCSCENTLTTSIHAGGARGVRRCVSCRDRLKSRAVRHPFIAFMLSGIASRPRILVTEYI